MLNLLPERFRLLAQQRLRASDAEDVIPRVRLTTTQETLCGALVAALSNGAACVVLTAAAGLGKTTVLTAALARLSSLSLQVIRLDDAVSGMEDAFQMLFTPVRQQRFWQQRQERRIVVVMDQAEAMLPEAVAYLDLLTRMPGKEASVQWVIAGRSLPWDGPDAAVGQWLRSVDPVRLTLPTLSEQDAWELFHHRVSSASGMRSAPRLVATLLQQSGGLPGRFDAALRSAIAAGLLKGTSAQAA